MTLLWCPYPGEDHQHRAEASVLEATSRTAVLQLRAPIQPTSCSPHPSGHLTVRLVEDSVAVEAETLFPVDRAAAHSADAGEDAVVLCQIVTPLSPSSLTLCCVCLFSCAVCTVLYSNYAVTSTRLELICTFCDPISMSVMCVTLPPMSGCDTIVVCERAGRTSTIRYRCTSVSLRCDKCRKSMKML